MRIPSSSGAALSLPSSRGTSASVCSFVPHLLHKRLLVNHTLQINLVTPPQKVALTVVRAIRQDLPEVIVNLVPVRPFLALEALFLSLIERFEIDEFKKAAQVAERQRYPTSEPLLT